MRILLYYHAGSKNHGCEAIVKTIVRMFPKDEIILYSYDILADKQFGMDQFVDLKAYLPKIEKYSVIMRIMIRLHVYQEGQECFKEMLNEKNIDWALAIGGDNYCYAGQPQELAYLNRELHKRGIKTALFGCSIDRNVLLKKSIINDLKRYNVITARESITYNTLKDNNLNNVYYVPDTAFELSYMKPHTLDCKVDENKKYVGINLSPLIIKKGKDSDIIYLNYIKLIKEILCSTEYSIMLIPHVFVNWDNDMDILKRIKNEFPEEERIHLVNENGCSELKWYISKCNVVICARTHVSIAAYSMNIPTLVVGYSVKSEGIAKDLFGTDKNYVLPVDGIDTEDDLPDAFWWIEHNSEWIVKQLKTANDKIKKELALLSKLFE